jgi:hypothetical protein
MTIDYDKVDLMGQLDSMRRGWQACEAERDSLAAKNVRLRAALEGLCEQVAISAQDSFGTCNGSWIESFRVEAPDECKAYEVGIEAIALAPPAAVTEAREREAGLLALVDQLRNELIWQREALDCGYYQYPDGSWSCQECSRCAKLSPAVTHTEECAFGHIERALSLTSPTALEELRRRERSIGAEEELRRIIYDLVGCYSGPSSTTITAGELDARADQILKAREKGL